MRVTAPSGIPSRLLLVSWTQGPGRRRRVARDLPPESSIGLSRARENRTFRGLALDAALIRHNVDPRCGLIVIDLKDGAVVEWVRIEGIVDELYDVAILPGVNCPALIGFKGVEVRRVISVEDDVRA